MPSEIVWTCGAEADLLFLYEQINDHDLALQILSDPLDRVLELLKVFPDIGPRVKGAQRVRKLLAGPRRRYGLFYVQEGTRIFIHALLDMRQDTALIARRLKDL